MTRVAVLGTGIMGSAMARNLLRAGLAVTVWDRSPEATAGLERDGARAAGSPAEAVRDADVVITMLPTAAVVESVMFGDHAAEAFAPGGVWAQMGTIGVEATEQAAARLEKVHPGVLFVDAPVSGSKGPAEQGQLLILASGPDAAKEPLSEPFAAIGRNTVWLGAAGQGSRMKLVVNAYMSTLIEGVAEAVELARRLDIDVAALDAAIEGGPLDAPIAGAKLHKIATSDYAPEFPLQWGAQGRRPGPGRRRRDRAAAAGRAIPPVACRRGRRPRTRRRQRCPPGAKRGPDRVSTPTAPR